MGRKAVDKVNITSQLTKYIDELVDRGFYVSRDEFVRACCRSAILEYMKLNVLIHGEFV